MDIDVSTSGGFSQIYNSMNNLVSSSVNPYVLVILTVVMVAYFVMFNYLGHNTTIEGPRNPWMRSVEIITWGVLVFLVLINLIQYFFKIDIKTAIKNIFSGKP